MITWIVAYDIQSDRSRAKVAAALKRHGLPMQKSVFLAQGTAATMTELLNRLSTFIDKRTDRICAWPLRVHWQAEQICRPAEATPLREDFVIG